MAEQLFAAVDLGAESGRVLVGKFDGERVTLEEAHRFPNTPCRVLDTLHWDVLRLWNDIQDGLSKAAHTHGSNFSGIGVDTWGVDFGLLDERDELLGNPVHYRDARNNGMMEHVFETVPREEVFASTGLQFMQFNSLFQLAAMKKQNSAQLPLAKSLLFTPDLFHFWLTGNKANEYSIASTSQMLDAKARAWDVDLLNRLGLPHEILQNIVAPGTKIGNVRESLATRLGMDANVPVIAPGSHDTASAVAAVPSQGENWAYLSSGTWSLMGIELREPLLGAEVLQRAFTNEGGVENTIRFLKNIAGLWLVQECRRTWLRLGTEYSYAELTQMAESAPAFKSIIEPDNARFAAPADMPQEIADYCRETGQAVPQSPGEFVRCCLESLALKYRNVLENLEELRGAKLDVLHIVGGGTQNKLLSRFTADCIARSVITGPVEGTGIGNILIQAMGLGELKNLNEIRAVVRASFPPETLEPNASERVKWDAAYEKFLTLP